jgi:nitronate monooxygenase
MVFVHKLNLRAGIKRIRELTQKPIGFNAIVEKTSKVYEDRMRRWVDEALQAGVRFFITALGNPRWVVDKVHAVGGIVYHDVTDRRWAEKALEGGVDGLICVNNRAGGHAGTSTAERLFAELHDLGRPLVCAGGIGDERDFSKIIALGYAGAQLGTRFIATTECTAHADYKQAILRAGEQDIVLTEKISGVPVAVIDSPYVRKMGTKAGPIARRLLRHSKAKHYMRMFYSIKSIWQLKQSNRRGMSYRDFFQAGKSVAGIHTIERTADIVARFSLALVPLSARQAAR